MLRIPLATYRLQFNADFDFQAATAIVSYLAELGISDIYASPIFKARQGSTHGYDVVDPGQLNPELGGMEAFEKLSDEVQSHQLGWLQDIVPNHMAFDGQNPILIDVLENGPDSQYRDYFDINWDHRYEDIRGRVLAPFLGKFYGDCLESGELQILYEKRGFTVNYYSLKFPLRIESYTQVLSYDLGRLRQQLGRENPDFVKLLGVLYALKYLPSGEDPTERYSQINFIKAMLWELWSQNEEIQKFLEENICTFNGEPGNPASFNLLDSLLSEQFFRLSYWKVGNEELNYRRFFTVNDLISLRMEDRRVFNTVHALVLRLLREKRFTGLRIDHIDGLYDPAQYLSRLRERTADTYITVEKILEAEERLPLNWPIQGTTGYDFLNKVNGIFCDQGNEAHLSQVYDRFIGESQPCQVLIDEKKRLIAGKHLAGDIDNLAHLLKSVSLRYRYASDFTIHALKDALLEILAVFPIYRTYVSPEGLSRIDRDCIHQVIVKAKENIPASLNELSFIEKFLLLDFDQQLNEEDRQLWLRFVMRFQQFTGPLMAKGLEDTVLYIYNRLLSLNEVGSNPNWFGTSIDAFHTFNHDRAAYWPHAMSATATHDTKRGEDMRARIHVLSEIPDEWETNLRKWHKLNAAFKQQVQGADAPDHNDEYFLYQTLLGAFPFGQEDYPAFIDRIKAYVIKSIREAKVHTAWLRPDTNYEDAFTQFVDKLLENSEENPFLKAFRPFQRKVQHYGLFNSLSQTLLKLTAPGVPDIYQGTELWDLSLVDPDNRRPVDFAVRQSLLKSLIRQDQANASKLIADLCTTPEDGRIKLFLTYKALQARQHYPDLFQRGDYQKLTVLGSLQDHVVAFARHWNDKMAIVIVPRLLTHLVPEGDYPLGEQVWQETRISLPFSSATTWQNLITGQSVTGEDTLWIREVLNQFPVALLLGDWDNHDRHELGRSLPESAPNEPTETIE